jgi:3-methyladenine DNA glycosylase AlkC
MADQLKDMFDLTKLTKLSQEIHKHYKKFDQQNFLSVFKTKEWQEAALNARVRLVSVSIEKNLNLPYEKAIEVLIPVSWKTPTGYFSIIFPDFVWRFGLDQFEVSMKALEDFTQTSSGEFAIRHFIVKYPAKTIKQMMRWSKSENHHLRRLSSEGCRPRLPWGMQLKPFVADPTPVLPILEQLKNDPSLYVRKSVANHLNDISRDHPELAIKIAKDWLGKSPETDWIVNHALRTLLKKGNKKALALFGHHNADGIEVSDLVLSSTKVKMGGQLQFQFSIENTRKKSAACRIEFAVDYMKSNGSHSRKVFQVSKSELAVGRLNISKKLSMADLTTRKHYPGKHELHILLNGEVKASAAFLLQ